MSLPAGRAGVERGSNDERRAIAATLTYDSGIDGFDFLAWRAAKAIRENGLSIDPTSAGNLLSLGVDADQETPPPETSASLRESP